ncbi:aldo/keto reductase, partial [bacterium]|nr:aldo/keto reductase [bacterium]
MNWQKQHSATQSSHYLDITMKSLSDVRHAMTVSCLIILMNFMLVSCNGKDNKAPISNQDVKANYLAFLSNVPFPESLTFCGEKVPLDIPEVRERAEREFYLNLQTPGQLILYIKRAGKFFPIFDQLFKEENVPEDLKYLAVAESALFMARSPKDALILLNLYPFESVQVNFNLIDHRALDDGLFNKAIGDNIGIIARTPLCFGYLAGTLSGKKDFVGQDHRSNWPEEQLQRWAKAPGLFNDLIKKRGCTPAQFALA